MLQIEELHNYLEKENNTTQQFYILIFFQGKNPYGGKRSNQNKIFGDYREFLRFCRKIPKRIQNLFKDMIQHLFFSELFRIVNFPLTSITDTIALWFADWQQDILVYLMTPITIPIVCVGIIIIVVLYCVIRLFTR